MREFTKTKLSLKEILKLDFRKKENQPRKNIEYMDKSTVMLMVYIITMSNLRGAVYYKLRREKRLLISTSFKLAVISTGKG